VLFRRATIDDPIADCRATVCIEIGRRGRIAFATLVASINQGIRMAIDYVLRMPCEVRKQFPEAKLVSMVRQWGLADFAIGKLRQANPGQDIRTLAENTTLEIAVNGPDGTTRAVPVTVAQIMAMVAPLGPVREHCKPCRANVSDRPFGCIAKINYPISRETEAWLLARLPDDEKNPNLSLLFQFLADLKIDGAPVDALRSREKIFEAKTAQFRTWGAIFDRRKITSSQILHMLAFSGVVGPKLAQLYTLTLGLDSILSERHPPSDQIEQFKTFFCAVVMAGRLNVSVDVDS